jgi:hypothetical protein
MNNTFNDGVESLSAAIMEKLCNIEFEDADVKYRVIDLVYAQKNCTLKKDEDNKTE